MGTATAATEATKSDRPPAPVVAGNTRFALDLYGKLRDGEGNRFFSPYSLSTALAMTYAGARGETAHQMAKTLHLTLPADQVHPAFRTLIDHINGTDAGQPPQPRPYTLLTANALWGQKGDQFDGGFLELTRKNYGAGLRQVDFQHHSAEAIHAINAWVEEQTRDKIKDLVGPADVTSQTALVLTNAIYFLGDWANPFLATATVKDTPFTARGGRKVLVPMMHQTQTLAYHDGGTFQLLELPYAKNALAMVVLLPKDVDGLPALEARITDANLASWIAAASRVSVEVALPKFTMTERIRLSDVLKSLGMTDAFDRAKADFSGIDGRRDLLISEVIHKAFVDVNEKGTEAAAATGVVMTRTMVMLPDQTVRFTADHPFVFLIRDRATGSLLFLGRLTEPKG